MTAAGALLMAGLLLAHALGDYTPLATAPIREAKARGGPLRFIALHAAIHAGLVGAVLLVAGRASAGILVVAIGLEFVTHFAIDSARALAGVRVPVLTDVGRNPFWWALGLDQFLHGLVLVAIALMAMPA